MNELDEIKNRLDIVDVISGYIKLEKAGANYRARCPFHDEKTASLMISPGKQIWHCFGCSKGGDMFEFVKEMEGVDFRDALEILAKKAGVELKNYDKSSLQNKGEKQKIGEVLEQALKFFEYYLQKSQRGKMAKEYLLKRGLSEDLIKDWRIGYAPDNFDKLSKFLEDRGYNKTFIEKAGLAFLKSNGGLCDRFRSRIIFPFFNLNSEIIGFTGRIFGKEDNTAKYLNTPSTILYDKSRALFGIDKAKIEIKKEDKCILVEGNVDCIMAHGAGTKNVVAVSGTALTDLHLKIIKRYTLNLVFAFDMDNAGAKATERAIDLARQIGFNVSILDLGKEKDPADIILKQGGKRWLEIINKAEKVMDFYFRKAFSNRDINNVDDKKKITEEILPQIKKIENTIEQAYFIQKLAQNLMVREDDVRKELAKTKIEKKEEKKIVEAKEHLSQKQKIEKKFLKLYLINTVDLKDNIHLFSKKYRTILEKLNGKDDVYNELNNIIEDKKFLSEIILGAEREKDLLKENDISVIEEIETCLLNLRKIFEEGRKRNLSLKIKNEKDPLEANKLIEEYLNLINQSYGKNK